MTTVAVNIEGAWLPAPYENGLATLPDGSARALTAEEQEAYDEHLAYVASAQEKADLDASVAAEKETALAAAEALRQAMFNMTDAIIDWCQDAQAFLYTAGAQGAFSPQAFMVLLQQAEGLLLQHKNLVVKTQAVNDQRDWMLQRGQQAQSILALAAVMK